MVNAILRVKKIGRARLAAMTQEWEEGCLMFTVTKKATKKKRAQDVSDVMLGGRVEGTSGEEGIY